MTDPRPVLCRDRLREEGKSYPRGSCQACDTTLRHGLLCPHELTKKDFRRQKQKYRHKPEEGIYGDCARTTLACLLNIERDTVPHFFEGMKDSEEHPFAGMNRWLLDNHGLQRVAVLYSGDLPPEAVMETFSDLNPNIRYQLIGESRTGCNHTVICKNGVIEHDTAINNSGIIGPAKPSGFYFVEFLVPASISR